MQLTTIDQDNQEAFLPLLFGNKIGNGKLLIGAVEDEKPVGALVLSRSESAAYIDHIFVREDYRRRGIGTALINETEKVIAFNCFRTSFLDSNEELMYFFESLGFSFNGETEYYSIYAKDFSKSKFIRQLLSHDVNKAVISMEGMTNEQRNGLFNLMKEKGEEDLLASDSLSKDLSFVSFDPSDNDPKAVLLCDKNDDDITITLLENYTEDNLHVPKLITAFSLAVKEQGLLDCNIDFVTINDSIRDFVEKIVEDNKPDAMMIDAIR